MPLIWQWQYKLREVNEYNLEVELRELASGLNVAIEETKMSHK